MKPSALYRLTCLLFLLLSGCGLAQRSPETRYYVLAFPAAGQAQAAEARAVTGPRVGVGPVSLPPYLDRQQIFIRRGDSTEVRLAEYDRWGESLSDGITRLLVELMSARLADLGGLAQPLRAAGSPDWRVSVNINRFDGAPGAEVILDADWSLDNPQGETLRAEHYLAVGRAEEGLDGLVRAHGELLAQFSAVLAQAVRSALSKNPSRR